MFGVKLRKVMFAAAIAAALLAPRYAEAQQVSYKLTSGHMRYVRTTSFAALAAHSQARSTTSPTGSVLNNPWLINRRHTPAQTGATAGATPTFKIKIPKIKKPPSLVMESAAGFPGIDAYLNSVANPIGATGYNLESEPPDLGLCVGNGVVLELTNTTIAAYDTSGTQTGIMSLYEFMDVALTTTSSIDLLSDPRCLYDPGSQNFYVTATRASADGTETDLRVAVVNSNTMNETLYKIPTTNDSGAFPINDSGCPCIEDEPLLGSNGTSVFISGNEFTYPGGLFRQNLIYVLSKADLNGGDTNLTPAFSVFSGLGYIVHHQILPAFSMSPAISPAGDYDTDNGGTEFFLASLVGLGGNVKKIALWAITGTCALSSEMGTPCADPVSIGAKRLGNKLYLSPANSTQASGDFPLGQSLGDSEPTLDTGDDRMQQVVYSGGVVYGSLTTAVNVGGVVQAGVLWASVVPKVKVTKKTYPGGLQVARVRGNFRGGYVGLPGLDLFYPSIAVNSSGRAVVAFDMSGASMFPSIGYANVIGGADNNVHETSAGVGPNDGFSAYPQLTSGKGSGIGRWGDYTTIVPDSGGSFWFGGQYIAQTCDSAAYDSDDTCGSTRAPFTNWATHITKLAP
jgi:hypothetical protein